MAAINRLDMVQKEQNLLSKKTMQVDANLVIHDNRNIFYQPKYILY